MQCRFSHGHIFVLFKENAYIYAEYYIFNIRQCEQNCKGSSCWESECEPEGQDLAFYSVGLNRAGDCLGKALVRWQPQKSPGVSFLWFHSAMPSPLFLFKLHVNETSPDIHHPLCWLILPCVPSIFSESAGKRHLKRKAGPEGALLGWAPMLTDLLILAYLFPVIRLLTACYQAVCENVLQPD